MAAALTIMWKGVVALFVVMGILYASIKLINKATSQKKEEK